VFLWSFISQTHHEKKAISQFFPQIRLKQLLGPSRNHTGIVIQNHLD